MQLNLNPTKTSSHFIKQCGNYFQLCRQIPLHWTMWYCLSMMETDYSTLLITVCSETSIQKKVFSLQWTMWYLFSVMETDATSVNNVILFISYGDRLIKPFNYCRSMVPSKIYILWISLPSVQLQTKMNDTGENMVFYSIIR